MPQEFCVVQCAGCHAFQVQQVKKKKGFTCPVCHKKQSVLKCFAISHSAKDCRLYVSQLNEARGAAEAQEPVERPALQDRQQPEAAAAALHSAAWEQFVGSDEDEALEQVQQHEEQEAGFVTHVPDAVKGSKQGRGSQASVSTDRQQRGGKKRMHVGNAEGDEVPEANACSSKSRRTHSMHVVTQRGWQRQPAQQPHMQQPMQRRPLNVAQVDISARGQTGVGAQQTVPKAVQQQQWPGQWPGQASHAPLCPPAGRVTAMAGSSQQQQAGMQRQWSGHAAANVPTHVPLLQQQQQQQRAQSYGPGPQQQRPQLSMDQKVQHQQPSQQQQHLHLHQQKAAPGSSGAWSAFLIDDGDDGDDCDGFESEELGEGLPLTAAQQMHNWGASQASASRNGMVNDADHIAAKATCNQAASRWGAVVKQQQQQAGGGIKLVTAFDSLQGKSGGHGAS